MTKHRYVLGKCDYNMSGRRNCEAAITWELSEDGELSMQAEILNQRNDVLICGQCVDTVAAYFPDDVKAGRMVAVWRDWHLNHLSPGTPTQMAEIRRRETEQGDSGLRHFDWSLAVLREAGLEPDTHDGKPYHYGSGWLIRTIPNDILAEIKSWGEDAQS